MGMASFGAGSLVPPGGEPFDGSVLHSSARGFHLAEPSFGHSPLAFHFQISGPGRLHRRFAIPSVGEQRSLSEATICTGPQFVPPSIKPIAVEDLGFVTLKEKSAVAPALSTFPGSTGIETPCGSERP